MLRDSTPKGKVAESVAEWVRDWGTGEYNPTLEAHLRALPEDVLRQIDSAFRTLHRKGVPNAAR